MNHVFPHVADLRELLIAYLTPVWLLTHVDTQVVLEVTGFVEQSPAVIMHAFV
jgi:hypothetical protein